MSNLATASLRQASRLCSRPPGSSAGLLRGSATRVAAASRQKATRRGYVSETKADNAKVNIDTAIRADQKAFVQQVGKMPENQAVPGTSVNADAMMSPMAGM
jgi:cysteine desulfurase